MTNPWLSVLMPTYNGETYLTYTMDSILQQKDSNIECIVVDDGSTDNTLSILNSYDGRLPIKVFRRNRGGNWVASTNYALSKATSEYICLLHQDDVWLKNRLSVMKQIIGRFPEAGFYLHATNFIDSQGRYLGIWRCPLRPIPAIITPTMMTGKLLIQNFIPILAPIFRRDIAIKIGGMDETLWYTADWDFWLKISSCSKTVYYPNPLTAYRIQPASQTFVRSSSVEDFRDQLETATYGNFHLWNVPDSVKKRVTKIADFSIQMNTALAGMFHKNKTNLFSLFITFVSLGPFGWFSYFRNSRIWERAFARLKAKLINRF